jgi:hypothetical protein
MTLTDPRVGKEALGIELGRENRALARYYFSCKSMERTYLDPENEYERGD